VRTVNKKSEYKKPKLNIHGNIKKITNGKGHGNGESTSKYSFP
jgi:hypothetical protein